MVGGGDARGNSLAVRKQEEESLKRSSHRVGQFVFFVADIAPFVMTKVNTGDIGEGRCQEMLIYWFTPVNRGIWEGAAAQLVKVYGGGAFNADQVQAEGEHDRIRRAPDTVQEE